MDCRIRPEEFAQVIGCTACSSTTTDPHLLRDDRENVPQPGYVGPRYEETRLLLVGQNPAQPPPGLAERDLKYTAALRALLEKRDRETYESLATMMPGYMRDWPIYDDYFSLKECGLDVTEIAYCNVVRCRTERNDNGTYWRPNPGAIRNCRPHLLQWLELLKPTAVILIGTWSGDKVCKYLPPDMPRIVMRRRSRTGSYMTSEEKECQRRRAAKFIQDHIRRSELRG